MKKFFCVSLVAALSLLFFSCSNFFSSSSSDNESAPNGKARVHFSVGKTDARTIMPEIYTEENISLVELTAQKISEGEATVYKFNGEKEKLSWNSLSKLEKASIDIDYGTYTFVLNLSIEDGEENKTVLVQTCTLENQEINAGTKELVFNMQEDSGDVSIAVSWELRDETNRIGKIKAGLYTIASNGETTIGISDAEKTLTIKGADTSVTATGSYASVPSGSYLIKLFLYDSESSTTPFNTITDIIKVNGYKTKYDLPLEFANLNLQYKVTFDPNGGLWEGDSEDSITTTRNMYSGFIPPKEVSKDGFVLVGWYAFEDGELSADLSQGRSSDSITVGPEMGARDYTFYAIWGKQAGGNLTTDNRALIIKTDAGDTIYQNSKINLSVTDSAGEPVTDGVTYDAKILYKGKDINDLGGKTYYSVDETQGVITLNGKTTPLPEANYQLYVTASRNIAENNGNQVTSSQTFNVKLLDGIETKVALYNYNSNTNTYNYYLTDSANVKTAALDGTADFTSSKDNFVFDANGNIYNLNGDSELVSNNTAITNQPLSLSEDLYGSKGYGLTIDLKTNIAYGYYLEETYNNSNYTYKLTIYKYPKLISDGSLEQKTSLGPNTIQLKFGYKVSINNNLLYLYGTADYTNYKVIVYDISSGNMAQFSEFNVTEYLTASERGFASTTESENISVNDIFATEGALYLLVQESVDFNSTSKDVYRRGSVIEYIPPETSGGTGTTRFLALKTTPAISKTAISNMALYYNSATNGNASGPLYAVAGTNNVSPSGREAVVTIENVGKTLAFPDIYGVNETEKYLSAPAKVIAVKPKKLVIADDGCAFYTDSECLKYKNMNRIVTVDLEDFVVESVQTTTAEFSSNISSYLKTDIAINTLEEIKTSQEDGYYFESSVKQWDSATIGEIKNQVYLAVKPGE